MKDINKELERLRLISDFLNGRLSPKQLEEFKKKIKEDPLLAEELHANKKLVELLEKQKQRDIDSFSSDSNDKNYYNRERTLRREQLRNELEKIKAQKRKEKEDWEKKISNYRKVSIGQIIIILVLVLTMSTGVFFTIKYLIDGSFPIELIN